MYKLDLQVFSHATEFLHTIPEDEQFKVATEIESIREGDFESAYIKTLRGPIKELIVRRRRIIFCIENKTLYILRAFTKKTMRTPKREIEISERLYKLLLQQLKTNK